MALSIHPIAHISPTAVALAGYVTDKKFGPSKSGVRMGRRTSPGPVDLLLSKEQSATKRRPPAEMGFTPLMSKQESNRDAVRKTNLPIIIIAAAAGVTVCEFIYSSLR
jgi:hypothetical protein